MSTRWGTKRTKEETRDASSHSEVYLVLLFFFLPVYLRVLLTPAVTTLCGTSDNGHRHLFELGQSQSRHPNCTILPSGMSSCATKSSGFYGPVTVEQLALLVLDVFFEPPSTES